MNETLKLKDLDWVVKSMNEYYIPLRSHLELAGINDEIINEILSCSYEINLDKGSIFSPEYEMSAICFLSSGLLRTDVEVIESRITNSSFVLQGAIFISSSPDMPSNISYRSLENSIVTCIPQDILYQGILRDESLYRFTLRVINQVNSFQRDWALLSSLVGKREHMLFTLMLMCIHSRLHGRKTFKSRYQELADFSGVSIQYAQKVILEASKAGAIRKVYGGFEVLNLEQLCNMVDFKPLNHLARLSCDRGFIA